MNMDLIYFTDKSYDYDPMGPFGFFESSMESQESEVLILVYE